MQIVGVQNNSFIDFPGKVSMVIFTGGCNFNCYYCHNRHILTPAKSNIVYSPSFLIKSLQRKKGFIDGVVISGGEPTLQPDLKDFMAEVKHETELPIKLDTNGTKPDLLIGLIKNGLVDYIAMDIKAPKNRYAELVDKNINLDDIEQSIEVIKASGLDYEFRTTFAPVLTIDDIIELCEWIKGAKRYALQQYNLPQNLGFYKDDRLEVPPHSKETLKQAFEHIQHKFGVAILRGVG
ncbi:MAG: anaerobic ribonucleoside-triphosphate reductase activating protein [Clostridiales bacterium]|jgi:pyruvate formate lyase activating enzyme|nr:anaerobic ribonucleoside-triphosphate reductase activating protein [Clostridiales bacterium]